MPRTPIQDTVDRWNRIASDAQRSGIPIEAVKTVGQKDIANVSQGKTGMSVQEAVDAVRAAAGQQTVTAPQRKTDLGSILGNVGPDVMDIVKGAPAGIAKFLYHLPSETTTTVKELTNENFARQKGFEDAGFNPSGLAAGLRNVSKLPLASLIPGLHTAAGLTTSEGRKSLEQHPAATALDLLPGVSKIAKAAGAYGLAARGLEEGSAVSRAEQPMLSALAKGGLKEAGRQYLESNTRYGDWARKLNIDIESMSLNRQHNIAKAQLEREVNTFNRDLASITKDMTPEEQQEAMTLAHTGGASTNPKVQLLLDKAKHFEETMAAKWEEQDKLSPLTIMGKKFSYATVGREGKVLESVKKAAFFQEKLSVAERRLSESTKFIEKEQTRLQSRLDEANKGLEFWKDKINKPKKFKPDKGFYNAVKRTQTWQRVVDNLQSQLESLHNRPVHTRNVTAYNTALRNANRANLIALGRMIQTAPAKFHPLLNDELRSRVMAKIGQVSPEFTEAQIQKALGEVSIGKLGNYFSPSEYKGLVKEVESTWLNLVQRGYDPVWVHSVPEHMVGNLRTRVVPDRFITPAQIKEKVFGNLSPVHSSLAVGVSSGALDYLTAEAGKTFIENHFLPRTFSYQEALANLQPSIDRAVKNGESAPVAFQRLLHAEYEKFDPARWGLSSARVKTLVGETDRYVPKHIARLVDDLATPPRQSVLRSAATEVNSIFKVSLFALSLKHFSHIVLGGFTAMMTRGGLDELTSFTKAWNMVKAGEMPIEIPQTLDLYSTDQLASMAAGSKAAAILTALHGKLGALQRTEEHLSNVERTMSYLGELQRQIKSGAEHSVAADEALAHVNKTFIDWYGYLPIERTIIKSIFPFYSFTKYALNYILSFPIDHPYRASIISHLAEAEQADWNSGLPKQWQLLYFMGGADSKGNVNAVDIRSIDPFRDIGNMFSLTGFFSGLGPLAKLPLEAVGVNTLSGTPELYPEVTYDPVTGKLVTKRTAAGQTAIQGLEDILPPVNTLDHFFGLSQKMRRLKASNPSAYRRQLFTSLNIPFSPKQYNLESEMVSTEQARYKAAQGAVSRALGTGSFSELKRYSIVPYQGQWVTPDQLEAYYLSLSPPQGVSRKAIIPKTRKRARV